MTINDRVFVSSLPSLRDNMNDHKPHQIIMLSDCQNNVLDATRPTADDPNWIATPSRGSLSLVFLDSENMMNVDCPKANHIESILLFADKDADIVVACDGGVSRSSATAIGLLCSRGMKPLDAVTLAFDRKCNIWSNSLMIRLFDQALTLGGDLIKAVAIAKGLPRCIDCGLLNGDMQDHTCRW